MEKYLVFIKNNRKKLLILLIVLNLIAIVGITQIKLNASFEIFTPANSDEKKMYDELNELFTSSDGLILMFELDNSPLKLSDYQVLNSISNTLKKLSFIEKIHSPAIESIKIDSYKIDFNTMRNEDVAYANQYYNSLGDISTIKFLDGNAYAIFTLSSKNKHFAYKEINEIEHKLDQYSLKHYISGNNYVETKVLGYIQWILFIVPPVALFLILFVFNTQIKKIKYTLLSIFPAGIAALWTLGIAGYSHKSLSFLTVLAPIFTIVIGSADGLHFTTHFKQSQQENNSNTKSLNETLRTVGQAMILTTITSIIGFLSLFFMDAPSIKELSVFASIGILLAGFITWFFLPVVLIGINENSKNTQPIHKRTKTINGTNKHILPIASIAIALTLFFTGYLHVKNEFNLLMIYRSFTKVQKSNTKISEVNGGGIPVYAFEENVDIENKEIITKIKLLESKLNNSKYVKKTMSYVNILEEIRATNENIPLKVLLENLSKNKDIPLSDLINIEKGAYKILIMPIDLNNDTITSIDKIVESFNESNNSNIQTASTQHILKALNEDMIPNQIKSSLVALIFIISLLVIAFKKVAPAFISMFPILLTLLSLFGFLGISSISLNIVTATIFSITIGVGIDYAIHYTSIYLKSLRKYKDSNKAMQEAFTYTKKPILANAFGLSIGFSALFLSPLTIHINVSILMWVTMILSVLFSLFVLPSILSKYIKTI